MSSPPVVDLEAISNIAVIRGQDFKADGSVDGMCENRSVGGPTLTEKVAVESLVFTAKVIDPKPIDITTADGKTGRLVRC